MLFAVLWMGSLATSSAALGFSTSSMLSTAQLSTAHLYTPLSSCMSSRLRVAPFPRRCKRLKFMLSTAEPFLASEAEPSLFQVQCRYAEILLIVYEQVRVATQGNLPEDWSAATSEGRIFGNNKKKLIMWRGSVVYLRDRILGIDGELSQNIEVLTKLRKRESELEASLLVVDLTTRASPDFKKQLKTVRDRLREWEIKAQNLLSQKESLQLSLRRAESAATAQTDGANQGTKSSLVSERKQSETTFTDKELSNGEVFKILVQCLPPLIVPWYFKILVQFFPPWMVAGTLNNKDVRALSMKSNFMVAHTQCQSRITGVKIDRSDSLRLVDNAIGERRLMRKDGDRRSNPLIAIFAAPGGGKSYFVDLIAHMADVKAYSNTADSAYSNTADSVVLSVTYNGASGTPIQDDILLQLSAEFGLGARALWSYFADQDAPFRSFQDFCTVLKKVAPLLSLAAAIETVRRHSGKQRILLLLDELIRVELAGQTRAEFIVSLVGSMLDRDANFDAVITSLKLSPIIGEKTRSGRPIEWIPLPPFTMPESVDVMSDVLDVPSLVDSELATKVAAIKLLISDVGGHPRGLESLARVLEKFMCTHPIETVDVALMMNEVTNQFCGSLPCLPSADAAKLALAGKEVKLLTMVDWKSVEDCIADGVYLNSMVTPGYERSILPKISVMQLRGLALSRDTNDQELASCLKQTLFRDNAPLFKPSDLETFHCNWEVLIRAVGYVGTRTLAAFYSRSTSALSGMPSRASAISIDFTTKPDGVVKADDLRSICQVPTNVEYLKSCRAVFLAKEYQEGHDELVIEAKTGGGYCCIFIDNKYARPLEASGLEEKVIDKKWQLCMRFLGQNPGLQELGIKEEDCFLIMACWREFDVVKTQNSRVIVLGRQNLAELYKPSLIGRPFFLHDNRKGDGPLGPEEATTEETEEATTEATTTEEAEK